MKKIFKINAALCDARKVREETLAPYDEIRINSAILLVNQETRALLGKYPVSVNTGSVMETDEDLQVVSVNGKHTLSAGMVMPQGKCYLMVNGKLEVEPGCEELMKSFVGITVNGKVSCPESLAGAFAGARVNGKVETYPDGCIRLESSVVLDRTFHLRAREGGRYYAAGRIIALDERIDFGALAAKGVTFITKKLLVAESLCEKAVPLFDERADITVLPDGCAYVDDDALLDGNLLRRYGDKLYINGDLTVSGESRPVLDQVAFLKVNGDLQVTRSMAEAAAGLNAEYDALQITAETVLRDRGSLTVTRALLEETDSLSVAGCGTVTIAPDVPASLIREKLESVIDCGTVTCTADQLAAVELIAKDVGRIRTPGQEETEDEVPDETVRTVNAEIYLL